MREDGRGTSQFYAAPAPKAEQEFKFHMPKRDHPPTKKRPKEIPPPPRPTPQSSWNTDCKLHPHNVAEHTFWRGAGTDSCVTCWGREQVAHPRHSRPRNRLGNVGPERQKGHDGPHCRTSLEDRDTPLPLAMPGEPWSQPARNWCHVTRHQGQPEILFGVAQTLMRGVVRVPIAFGGCG